MIHIESNPNISAINKVLTAYCNSYAGKNFVILAWLHEVIAKHPEFMFELANPLLIEQAAKFVDDMDAILREFVIRNCNNINNPDIRRDVRAYVSDIYILCIGFRYCISRDDKILKFLKNRSYSARAFSAMEHICGPKLISEILSPELRI